ncbi:MAG: hypothetical protein ACLP50_14750 [Solirubrobacteraceae bacterium]
MVFLLNRRLLALILALTGFSAMICAGHASAATWPGPTTFSLGLTDDNVFESPSASVRTEWFGQAQAIGSTWARIYVHWDSVAPEQLTPGFDAADPAAPQYRWSALDAVVRSASAAGQKVVLMVLTAPTWAEGANAPARAYLGTWRPSPSDLGAFARALATRYSGHFPDPLAPTTMLPRVSFYQAWDEPNLSIYLSPQWTKTHGGQPQPASPAIYRSMLNAFYANVKAVAPQAQVLAAGTAPYGDPPGGDRMMPVLFLREMLCLHGTALTPESCPDPAHFDALDHHPYASAPWIKAFYPDDVSVPDIGKLAEVLSVAERTHRALPAGRKQIWITEIDWGSAPPLRSGVSLAVQARYLSDAFYILWSQGVSHVMWFLIRDLDFGDGFFTGGGLYFVNGRPKPAAAAFRFPFVALPGVGGSVTLWGKAPAAGTVTIERRVAGAWRTALRLSTTAGGVFYAVRDLASGAYRAQLGQSVSVPWTGG